MIDQLFINGPVMTNAGLIDGLAVGVEAGRIVAVGPAATAPVASVRHDLQGMMLWPGFIDTQVNGGGNSLFNTDPSIATIAQIGAAHRRFGTTGFLPTLISDDLSVVEAALAAARAAIVANIPGVLGAHIEGPFLSSERGGIHEADRFRRLDEAGIAVLTTPGAGRILVTLAPEMVDAAAVRRLVAAGITISAGHTNVTAKVMSAALDDGFTGFTHLFNAMSPMTSREPGVAGAALASEAWCGIIVDGRHVDPMVLRIALACRRRDRFMLVTDAMPCVGGDRSSFVLQGKRISVRDGACYDAEGRLAGSDLDMATAVRNAVAMLGVSLLEASRMASANPAAFLGLGDEVGRIAEGLRADLVVLDDDLQVRSTWIGGVSD